MGKPYDLSGEDLLADRTSFMIFDLRILVHVYLMFVVYRTNVLKYNLFYLCVCVRVCFLLYCNAYFSYYICRQQSSYEFRRKLFSEYL